MIFGELNKLTEQWTIGIVEKLKLLNIVICCDINFSHPCTMDFEICNKTNHCNMEKI